MKNCKYKQENNIKQKGFSLFEVLLVMAAILVLLGLHLSKKEIEKNNSKTSSSLFAMVVKKCDSAGGIEEATVSTNSSGPLKAEAKCKDGSVVNFTK